MDAEWDSMKPFVPTIGKEGHLSVAAVLMLTGFFLTGLFSINKSVTTAPLLAIPASLALGFGSVYLICAVGVYV
ncbi:hypothetical protein L873DRAFT_1809579 [Choiromyces venosus 120613-1]|uniref:Dolichyl-diphosphooligosaccharide-protein glycosyltransferase subunit OST5 n=1 Tax=Choiromyces venosus 120613-1 TaxID=1336337 RepID=A0A3N4JLA8_9PEZI|nr:hypothetical protein L873DRAFT_1809579 [Choiromyces venosus 120613-1]